jgi:outer membrane murein-binding lipoprotein Lpp
VCAVGVLMKAVNAVLSALLVAGCSQVIDQFYSKKNFDTQSFTADIAQCKEHNPSFAMHIGAAESKD